jgi:hypothetical protein
MRAQRDLVASIWKIKRGSGSATSKAKTKISIALAPGLGIDQLPETGNLVNFQFPPYGVP